MKKHVISIANSGKVAPVNLETLKLYCDVVRLRSFSRGAASNAVSQSAASQAIQQLEAELDAALLDRSRRPLLPTEQGQAFYDACRALLQGFEKRHPDIAVRCEEWTQEEILAGLRGGRIEMALTYAYATSDEFATEVHERYAATWQMIATMLERTGDADAAARARALADAVAPR